MLSRMRQWLRRHNEPRVIRCDSDFIPWSTPTIIRFRWVTYTTKHKRGPAKGRRRYQFTSGRQTL